MLANKKHMSTRLPAVIDSLMLLSNGLNADPRVQKEARSLARRSFRVRVLAWDRVGDLAKQESRDGYEVVRYARPSPPGSGLRQATGFLRFSLWSVIEGIRMRPRMVHCHDLDTFLPGLAISVALGIPLLFDSHELYAEMQRGRMPRLVVALLWMFEKMAIRRADATLVVGESIREYLLPVREDLIVIGNWHDVVEDDPVTRANVRAELGIPEDGFAIAFVGGFQSTRNLEPLFEAVNADEQLYAIVAGRGDQEPKVRAWAERQSRIRFVGFTNTPARYFAASDALYYLFAPGYEYANFSTSNTVGLSFAHRRPLITDRRGDTGRVAASVLPEITVREHSAAEVLRAVNVMREPAFRSTAAERLQAAAAERYSWTAAERELARVYQRLLGSASPRATSEASSG